MFFRDTKQKGNILAQKSHCKCLKKGDTHSKFFHNFINKRRKRNEIVGININGSWFEEVDVVKKGVHDHFKSHFHKEIFSRPIIAQNFARRKLSDVDNNFLIAPFSEEETKEAVWLCDSGKSLGPNGFNFLFIKKFWGTIKLDMMKMIEDFHLYGKPVKGIKLSFIVLIPKKEAACELEDFRPISLIGGIYKILSMTLVNIFSKILESIILES